MPFPGSSSGYDTQSLPVSTPFQAPGLTPQTQAISSKQTSSLIFIDAAVQDSAALLPPRSSDTQVYYLNSTEDAIDQITRTLLTYDGISSVHLISHGDSGRLKFASGWLGADNLGQYTTQLKSWSQALSANADVLLYGCDIASGAIGDRFIHQLSQLTQADVAASTNKTGNGGDWILEDQTGTIESAIAPDQTQQAGYGYSLDQVKLISQSNPLLASDAVGGDITGRSVSQNGQFVVFSSNATNLVAGDTNNRKDIFLLNRTDGSIKLISHANGLPNQSANGDSIDASISGDGKYVVFISKATNLTTDATTGTIDQIYRWNSTDNSITLITKNATAVANGGSSKAVISADGKTIAFISTASNLSGTIKLLGVDTAIQDTNGKADTFLWKEGKGTLLISMRSLNDSPIPNSGTNGVASNLELSDDGRFVVFDTTSVLASGIDQGGGNDFYVYDAINEALDIVSFDTRATLPGGAVNNNVGRAGGGAISTPSISFQANKLRITFSSTASLVDGDTNGTTDVLVAERDFSVDPAGTEFTVKLVSAPVNALAIGDGASSNAVISASGRYVAFTSSATNLLDPDAATKLDTNGVQDIFVRDLDEANPTLATRLVSRNSGGGALANGKSSDLQISDDGNIISFVSAATNLVGNDVANDPNGVAEDVFVYNRTADTLTLASQKFGATTTADIPTNPLRKLKAPIVSGDGSVVLYGNDATNIVDKDTNDSTDVFAYAVATPGNTLVTKVANNQNSVTGAGVSTIQAQGSVSKDGRYVVFVSDVNSLVTGDRNGQSDVFLRDTTLPSTDPNAIKLISHLAADPAKSASGASGNPFISADGKYVVFSSAADDLVATDTNTQQDIFLYTVATGAIELISKGAAPADGASDNASIAVSGAELYVTFTSKATNLGATVAGGFNNVYLWKKSTGQIKLVSRTATGVGGNQDSSDPIISADGNYIAFTSLANNLTGPVSADTHSDVFLYNIAQDTLKLVSQSAAGAIGNAASLNPVISDINGVVAFESTATNLTALADTNNAADIFRYSATTNTIALVSVNAAGTAAGIVPVSPTGQQEGSSGASINADGTAIAFTSTASNLTATPDTNADRDVFVRNTTTNSTTLISKAKAGNTASNGASSNVVISGDGQTVAFISTATDLATLDTTAIADVYVSSTTAPAPALISTNTAGTGSSDANATTVTLNRDGGFVVFDSDASNLIANDANASSDVFQRPTKAIVSLKATTATATEGDATKNGVYELNRTDTLGVLQVKLSLSAIVGSATAADFTLTADGTATVVVDPVTGIATVTMPDGVAKVILTLTAKADNKAEADETATFTIDVNAAYTIDPTDKLGTVTIAANETIVTTNADSGEGSLRQAILNANAFAGPDTISFTLADPTKKTIALATTLADVSGETIIDGGTSGIILDGTNAGATANGLTIAGGNSTVKNITIQNFKNDGILISSDNNTIGGTTGTPANPIANTIINNNAGVVVQTGKVGNRILGNKIDTNTLLGIDLEPVGPDADTIALTTAIPTGAGAGTGATITGTLTRPAGTYRVEFFASTTQDAAGQSEGEIFIGFQDIVVDASGSAAVNFISTVAGLSGKYVTATVTDAAGTTSEFSKNKRITPPLPIVDLSTTLPDLAEGDTGTKKYTFTVKLSQKTATPLTLNYRTLAGTGAGFATAGTDFTAVTTGSVTILANTDTATFDIDILGDTRYEPNETFQVELFGLDPALVANGVLKATGTIKNDDQKPTISFSKASFSQAEGQAAPNGFMPITVTLSNASDEVITVDYKTVDGTAISTATQTNPADFVGIPTGTLTFAAGETTKDILVELIADTIDEPSETFTVELATPTNATLAGGAAKLTATGNITPDEQGYLFSVLPLANPKVTEGAKGSTQKVTFTVTLDRVPTEDLTVTYSTVDGTATGTANGGTDFVDTTGTLTFKANGALTQTVDVVVNGDDIANGDRNFTLELSNPTVGRATIDPAKQASPVTIVDDDLPTLSFKVGQVSRIEGPTGQTTAAVVTVELSAISNKDITVDFTTLDGTGADAATVADGDYVARTGKITIVKGQKSATASFTINGDAKVENDETFLVKLSNPVGAVLAGSDTTSIAILDDDRNTAGLPKVSITANADATQVEGNTGTKAFTFTVSLDQTPATGKDVAVTVSTIDGTAISTGAAADFTANTKNLTFTAGGPLTQTFTVLVNGDTQVEPNETFTVQLSNATNGAIGTGSAIGTITDDDTPAGTPKISITAIKGSDTEGNTGTKTLTYAVTLDKAPIAGQSVTVDVVTVDGTGATGAVSTGATADFVGRTQTLTFLSNGSLTQQFDVTINGDTLVESDETFNVELRNVTGAAIATGTAIGTIINDDGLVAAAPVIAINSVSLNEGDTGTKPFVFDINLTNGPADRDFTVTYTILDGSATVADNDYQRPTNTGTITFKAGDTKQSITVLVNGDKKVEGTETFSIKLSNPTAGATFRAGGGDTAIGSIVNDDIADPGNNISLDSPNDLLWRNPITGETLVWQTNLGPTTRTFSSGTINAYNTPEWRYVGNADFDGDGDGDLLWHNIQTGDLNIWKMDGSTIETVITDVITPAQRVAAPWFIQNISDYNRDGNPDLLWYNQQTGKVSLTLMNGFKYLSAIPVQQVSDLNWKIEAVANFAGDPQKSIFWRNQQTGATVLWRMTDTRVTSNITLKVAQKDLAWQVKTTADLNGDGTSDLVWQNQATNAIAVWYMQRSGIVGGVFLPTPGAGFKITGSADFNRDGINDLLLQNTLTGQNQVWYFQQSPTGITYGSSAYLPNSTRTQRFLGTSQLTKNGAPSLLWLNETDGSLTTWEVGTSNYGNSIALPTLSNLDIQILDTVDLNRDGKSEVLVRNKVTNAIELGDFSSQTYSPISTLPTLDQTWVYRGTGDTDGDGTRDIYWQQQTTGNLAIWRMNGGQYVDTVPVVINNSTWKLDQIGDFDGDGKADLLWRNQQTDQVYIGLMNGSVLKSGRILSVLPKSWQIVKTIDLDQDGRTDVIWRNTETGVNYAWLMNGNSLKKGILLPTIADQGWQIKEVADFTRDGNPDILWYNSRLQVGTIWTLASGEFKTVTALAKTSNSSWDLVGTRDFNGDGSRDLLWLDQATGTPTIWYMNDTKYATAVSLPNLSSPNFKLVGLADYALTPV